MEQIMEQSVERKGLTGFQLKYFAVILMVLDHIHYFFEFTGKIPIAFSMLGRMAAPIFLYFLIEGFVYTKNRKIYFLRIYIIGIVMGLIQYFTFIIPQLKRVDGFYPQNQMMATFAIVLAVLQGVAWCQEKKWTKGIAAVSIPILLPFLCIAIGTAYPTAWSMINLLHFSILPLHTWILDGGTIMVILGIAWYLLHKSPKKQMTAFAIIYFLYYVVQLLLIANDLTWKSFFTEAYEWMGVFAAIPLLFYNGKRGNGSKTFFYWFYPAHIYTFYVLSYFSIKFFF